MNKYKKLSLSQYGNKIGLTRQAVLYRINNNIELPGVEEIEQIGKAYILTIKQNWRFPSIKNKTKNEHPAI